MNIILERLVDAIQQERIDILKLSFSKLDEEGPSGDVYVKDILSANYCERGTLLHIACQIGSVDAVRTLLQEGANPCTHDSTGKFPLDVANNKNIKDAFIQACIQAICCDNLPSVTHFLESGVSVNSLDSVHTGNTLLHWAVCFGNFNAVRLLLNRGAEVNSANVHGVTPLHESVIRGDLRIAEELLNYGANSNICALSGPHAGRSPLELAEQCSTMRQLLEHPAQINVNANLGAEPCEKVRCIQEQPTQPLVNGVAESCEKVDCKQEQLAVVYEAITDPSNLLWPMPQHLELRSTNDDQRFVPHVPLRCCLLLPTDERLARDAQHVAQKFMEELSLLQCHPQLQIVVQGAPLITNQITLQMSSSVANGRQDGYQIHVSNDQGMLLFGSNPRALLYACSTAIQLLYLYQQDGIPNLRLVDWPCLPVRAFLLEVSKRAPLQPSVLIDLLRHLAKLKATHIFFFVHLDPTSCLPVYSVEEWISLVERVQEWLLKPGLVLEIGSASDVALSDLEASIKQLFAIFPQDCALQIGPRLSARLLERFGEDKSIVDILLDDSIHCHSVWNRLVTTQPLQICANALLRLLEDFGTRSPLCHRLQPVVYCLPGQEDATALACQQLDNFGLPYCVLSSSASWRGLSAGASAASVVALPQDPTCLGLFSAEWTASSSATPLTHHVSGLAAHLYALGLVWNKDGRKTTMAAATTALDNHLLMRHSVCSVLRELGLLEAQICHQFSLSQESPSLTVLHQPQHFLKKWNSVITKLPSGAQFRLLVRKLRQLRRHTALRENHRISRLVGFTIHCALCATQLLGGLQLNCEDSANSAPDNLTKMFSSALGRPIRTDLANQLLLLEEESRVVWSEWYLESPPMEKMFGHLIDLLLCDEAAIP